LHPLLSFEFIALGIDKHMIVAEKTSDTVDIVGIDDGYKFQNHVFIPQRPPDWIKIYPS